MEETRWRAAGLFEGSGRRLRWGAAGFDGERPLSSATTPRGEEDAPPETRGGPSSSNPPQPYLTRRVSGGSVGLSPSNTSPPNGLVRIWGGFTLDRANPRQTQLKHGCRTRPDVFLCSKAILTICTVPSVSLTRCLQWSIRMHAGCEHDTRGLFGRLVDLRLSLSSHTC
jgi:hypothetical protein